MITSKPLTLDRAASMTEHEQAVKTFFDDIADTYRERHTQSDPLLKNHFEERIAAVTEGFDFETQRVLDIGAGTGSLYDYLRENCRRFDYSGCDISARMLATSNIPQERQFVGTIENPAFQGARFDFIFMLGLTTYLPKGALSAHLDFAHAHLAEGGRVIVSFTNGNSLDMRLRHLLRFVFQIFRHRHRVISQPFSIFPFHQKDAAAFAEKHGFAVEKTAWINRTVFPFARLAPRFSVRLARFFRRKNVLPKLLATDFILFLRAK
jgi:SAM-dependent methyltransferase